MDGYRDVVMWRDRDVGSFREWNREEFGEIKEEECDGWIQGIWTQGKWAKWIWTDWQMGRVDK